MQKLKGPLNSGSALQRTAAVAEQKDVRKVFQQCHEYRWCVTRRAIVTRGGEVTSIKYSLSALDIFTGQTTTVTT